MRCWHCGKIFTPPPTEVPVEVSCPGCGANLGIYTPVKQKPLPPTPKKIKLPMPPPIDEHEPVESSAAQRQRSVARIIILVIGLIFLAAAGVMGIESHHISSTYERANGSLIRKQIVRTGRSTSCVGTIAFTASDGQTYHAEIGGAGFMKVGESVKVLYRRDNPSDNRADAPSSLWGFPIAAGGLGAVLMIIWVATPGPSPIALPPLRRRRLDDE